MWFPVSQGEWSATSGAGVCQMKKERHHSNRLLQEEEFSDPEICKCFRDIAEKGFSFLGRSEEPDVREQGDQGMFLLRSADRDPLGGAVCWLRLGSSDLRGLGKET